MESAEPIYLRDAITSGTRSGMQVILMDESVFTIGPGSELEIDEFVYDPGERTGNISASMAKGVMRFVTGKIAAGAPQDMTIKLPVGTIGIRGTVGIVQVLTPELAMERFPNEAGQLLGSGGGQADAPVVFATLVGPGPNNNAGSGVGSFDLTTPDGTVGLNRIGASALATPGAPPVFFIAPPQVIQDASGSLNAQPEEGEDDEGGTAQDDSDGNTDTGGTESATAASGQNTGRALSAAVNLGGSLAPVQRGSDLVNDVILSVTESDIITFEELRGVSGSTVTVSQSSINAGAFSYDFFSQVNFSARQWTVHFDNISNGGTVTNGDIQVNPFDYSSVNGDAVLSTSNGNFTVSGCSPCAATAEIEKVTSTSVEIDIDLTVDGVFHENGFTLQ